jgi:hypothetical protein
VTTISLRGLACGPSGLDPTTIVPETVPVWVEYDYAAEIGTAALRRDDAGIWAEAAVEDGPWQETCRYFGMSFRCGHLAAVPGAGLGEAIGVSLVAETAPWSGLPPYEVVYEPDSGDED